MDPNQLKNLFFEKSVPEVIKNKRRTDLILRARVLYSLYVSNLVICFLLILFFSLALLFTNNNFWPGLTVSLAATGLLALQLYFFYSAANIEASATFFSMTLFALSLAGVILTGGWHSSVLILFFCCPAVSFLIGGRNEGFYMSGLVYVCGLLLMIAHHTGFQVFQIINPEKEEWIRFYIWIISTILLTSCLTVYDSLLASFRKR